MIDIKAFVDENLMDSSSITCDDKCMFTEFMDGLKDYGGDIVHSKYGWFEEQYDDLKSRGKTPYVTLDLGYLRIGPTSCPHFKNTRVHRDMSVYVYEQDDIKESDMSESFLM